MARTRKNQTKVCTVTGLKQVQITFIQIKTHAKAVDNLRRNQVLQKSK